MPILTTLSLSRLTRKVTNPKGQITSYTYDAFGRVKSKTHPDLGTISYTYDNLGNVRFSQDARQAEKNLLTFTQYDDLNRVTVAGEAYIDENGTCPPYDDDNPASGGCGDGSRLTDKLDGNVMHVAGGSILTANRKMFVSPAHSPNSFPDVSTFTLSDCDELQPEPRLGETEPPTLPLVKHQVVLYRTASGGMAGAPLSEFEDVALHPEFVRVAVAYDTLPSRNGTAWKNFPGYQKWHQLAPTGKVRNQRGHEAAVAYRDRSAEPFHYTVMSFDERGRVEALLRYNENLGFDAVYYSYNSANNMIAVTVADPVRKFTTWYGYDQQGRIDTVWTKLYEPGSGLVTDGNFSSLKYPGVESRTGLDPEIVYSYTKLDRVATMRYPAIDVLVDYAYNHRKLLDSMVATRLGSPVFRQEFLHDLSALIIDQKYAHGAAQPHQQHYWYDPAQRLVSWYLDGTSTTYEYDEVGSRQRTIRDNEPAEPYSYYSGTNRLQYRRRPDALGNDTLHTYGYDANGARTSQAVSYEQPTLSRLLREEYFGYSFRGLNNRARVRRYENGVPGPWEDWRYRYSASGEREQKRLYPYMDGVVPAPDSAIYAWCYYLLGGSGSQLAVYHGQHLDSLQSECGDFGKNRVYLYPFQYITYGASDVGAIITKPTGAREYKITDHLGSTRVVLDENGNVAGMYDNAPFGEQIAVTGVDTRTQYIDKEKDRETGTANHGVRQYDPEIGAFPSSDPHWEDYPTSSPYTYAANNPLRYIDPTGFDPTGTEGDNTEEPGQDKTWQTIKGVVGVIGGGLMMAAGLALAPTGFGAALIALSIPVIGGSAAILIDVATAKEGQKLREIPVGVGEAVGMAVKNEYGVTWAPLAGSLAEGALTKGFTLPKGEELHVGLELLGWSMTSISTAQQTIETAHDLQHPNGKEKKPAARTSTKPYIRGRILGGSGAVPGTVWFD